MPHGQGASARCLVAELATWVAEVHRREAICPDRVREVSARIAEGTYLTREAADQTAAAILAASEAAQMASDT